MNYKNNIITVIVPCYNVESYLQKSLNSLLNQTIKNFKVIMVEDKSTDNTKSILEKYSRKYDNFTAIYNEENVGLGQARNKGLEHCNTKYVSFLDSDDWYPRNFLESMIECLEENNADIAICDIYLKYDDISKNSRIIAYNNHEDMSFIDTGMAASSCNKIFKTELFDTIKFPNRIVNEDIAVIIPILLANKTVYTDKTYFNYYQRNGSIQNGKITERRFEVFEALNLLKQNYGKSIDEDTWNIILWHQLTSVVIYVLPRERNIFNRIKLVKKLNSLLSINNINLSISRVIEVDRLTKIYAKTYLIMLKRKRYLSLCVLMTLFNFFIKNRKHVNLSIQIIRTLRNILRHEYLFFKHNIYRLHRILFRKKVIKNNFNIQKLKELSVAQSKMNSKKKISVIIPNYNYEKFIYQRIGSILHQKFKIGEIIFLDDFSIDDSIEIADKIKSEIGQYIDMRVISNNSNRGTFNQWKLGFKESKYEYVWIAEADDFSSKDFLSSVMEPFETDKKVVLSYCNTLYINESGFVTGNTKNDVDYMKKGHWNSDYIVDGKYEVTNFSYLNNTIANVSSVVFKVNKNMDYDSMFNVAKNFKQAGDWVFYIEYMLLGKIAFCKRGLNYYRVHGNNVSSTIKLKFHLEEIKKVYDFLEKKIVNSPSNRLMMKKRIHMLSKLWKLS